MALVARKCFLILSVVAQVLLVGSLTLFWLQLLWGGWANSSGHPSLGATAVVPPSWVRKLFLQIVSFHQSVMLTESFPHTAVAEMFRLLAN